jgi:hypothetical protein
MTSIILMVTLASLSTALFSAPQSSTASAGRERYTAAAIGGGGPLSNPVAQNVEITIDRWSTGPERRQLVEAMRKGQNELLKALRDMRAVGSIRAPGNLAYNLHYAHQVKGEDGGRRIFLATDRPINAWEALNQPRTVDYPFTFVRLTVDVRGEGKGTLSLATRVIVDDEENTIDEFERYTWQPIQLNNVKRVD